MNESEEQTKPAKLDKKKQFQCPPKRKQRSKLSLKRETNNKNLLKLFLSLKSSSKEIREFQQLSQIEKEIKNNSFSSYVEFSHKVRKIFSNYFNTFSFNPDKYKKIYQISTIFEELVADYDKDIFIKNSKSFYQAKKKLNRLKRNTNQIKKESMLTCISNSKFKISFDEQMESAMLSENIQRKQSNGSLKKYKVYINKRIQKLTLEQKKELIQQIPKSCLITNENDTFEIDLVKMNFKQLKDLNNYMETSFGNSFNLGQKTERSQDSSAAAALEIHSVEGEGKYTYPSNDKPFLPSKNHQNPLGLDELSQRMRKANTEYSSGENNILNDDDISESLSEDSSDSSNE